MSDSHTGGGRAQTVPCGKCPKCLQRRANGWAFRIKQELKHSETSAFITLTYDDENVPYSPNGLPTLEKSDLQKFWKRLRKHISDNYLTLGYRHKKDIPKIKYYACGEYGGETHRPHYHAIVLNAPNIYLTNLEMFWKHGFVHVGKAENDSIHYVSWYINKPDPSFKEIIDTETGEIFADDRQHKFAAMSKNLGLKYLTPQMIKFYRNRQLGVIVQEGGQLLGMPRYYKNKLFTKVERMKMAQEFEEINKFDYLKFDDTRHQIEYIKDQFRKQKKLVKTKRVLL